MQELILSGTSKEGRSLDEKILHLIELFVKFVNDTR